MSKSAQPTSYSLKPREHVSAFQVGRAFLAVAEPTLDQLSRGIRHVSEQGSLAAPDLAVAVTNFGFALELYLKSIRAWIGLETPETHDLWVLYKSLPASVRNELEISFDKLRAERDPTTIRSIQTVIEESPDGSAIVPEFPSTRASQHDIPNLLKRTRSLAVSWRYPNDAVPAGKRFSAVQTFEHSLLVMLATVLSEFIQSTTNIPFNVHTAA
jgi:hypothetical protein